MARLLLAIGWLPHAERGRRAQLAVELAHTFARYPRITVGVAAER